MNRRSDSRSIDRLSHHDGSYRWVLDTGQPQFLPDGAFNGYTGSCVDIEARKSAEAAKERLTWSA